jgi:hypothetical protein
LFKSRDERILFGSLLTVDADLYPHRREPSWSSERRNRSARRADAGESGTALRTTDSRCTHYRTEPKGLCSEGRDA